MGCRSIPTKCITHGAVRSGCPQNGFSLSSLESGREMSLGLAPHTGSAPCRSDTPRRRYFRPGRGFPEPQALSREMVDSGGWRKPAADLAHRPGEPERPIIGRSG